MRHLFWPIALLIIIAGCKEKQEGLPVIKADIEKTQEVQLSDIVEDAVLIQLETNPECLIKTAVKVKATSKNIFISENDHLLEFNYDGDFIKQIGMRGRGPGEHSGVLDFCLDTISGNINILSFKNIIQYNEDGQFIKKSTFNGFPSSIEFMDSLIYMTGTYFSVKQHDGKYHNISFLYRIDRMLNIVDSLFIADVTQDIGSSFFDPQVFHFSGGNKASYFYFPVSLYEPFARDTLFTIQKNGLVPYLKIKLGDEERPLPKAQSQIDGVPPYKDFRIRNIYKKKERLFIEYEIKKQSYFGIYNESDSHFYTTEEGVNDDIYQTGKVKLRPLNCFGYQMYFSKNSYEVYKKIEGLKVDGNPIIIIAKLKD